MFKTNRGVNILELMISLVIFSILVIVTYTVYRGNQHKAIMAEGVQLINMIKEQQEIYYTFSNKDKYMSTSGEVSSMTFHVTGHIPTDIDSSKNKYFKTFKISAAGTGKYRAEAFYKKDDNIIAVVSLEASESEPYIMITDWKGR